MRKKGISLITLVITIVVIIILAGVIILTISNNNPIQKAKEARDKSNEVTREELRIKQLTSLTLSAWDGSVASSLRGSGTQNDPYQISNGSELVKFAEIVNGGNYTACAKLTNSINMGNKEFIVIADSNVIWYESDGSSITKKYNGVFDGDGNVITGISINKPNNTYIGMCGALGENGIIKNLNLYQGNISAYCVSGAVVGYSEGIIENCTNSVSVKTTNGYSGGISGITVNGRIDNCINNGNIVVKEYISGTYDTSVGGITAYIKAIQNQILIQNCKNYG